MIFQGADFERYMFLFFVVLLMLVNWFLEVLKWKLLSGRNLKNSFEDTSKSVALSLLIPSEIAELVTKSFKIHKTNEAIIGSVVQTLVTIFFGIGSLYFLGFVKLFFVGIGFVVLVIGFLIWLLKSNINCGFVNEFKEKLSLFVNNKKIVFSVLMLAIVRYLVFVVQFIFLAIFTLTYINVSLLLSGFGVMMLVKTIVPSAGILGDVGIREVSAYWVFQDSGLEVVKVMWVSLILWAVNILPISMCGIWFWLKRKNNSNSL